MEIKTIGIFGCGWYGLPLAELLVKEGYQVKGSTTSVDKLPILAAAGVTPYLIEVSAVEQVLSSDFFINDLLLISIPPKKSSPEFTSYLSKIEQIAVTAANAGVKEVIFISSTGVFEDGNFIVDESYNPNPNTETGKILYQAEETLKQNPAFGTTVIRFAGLFGPGRNLAKHFAGKKDIPNGGAPVNLIHLKDCLGLSLAIIKQMAFGALYHGVNPSHPTRAEFYTQKCEESGFEKPVFRNEILTWKQIESKNVPNLLNYKFSTL